MTVPGPLPYIGFAPSGASGVDLEFLWPDRTIGYLQTMAPPGIWTVIGDAYPCAMRRATFYGAGVFDVPDTYVDMVRANEVNNDSGAQAFPGFIDSGMGDVLCVKFASDPVQFSEILAGVWELDVSYQLIAAGDGDTRLFYEVGKLEPDTTETVLFTGLSDVLQAAGGIFLALSKFDVPLSMTFAPGDEVYLKVYARTTSTGGSPANLASITWIAPHSTFISTPFVVPVFDTPAADGAPWTLINGVSVLTDYPEAGDFLGVLITDIDGLDATLSRNVTRKAISLGGGALEKEHAGPRTVTIKGVMVATSSCGLEWGERWLQQTLAAPPCAPCGVEGYTFRECCPPSIDESFYGSTGLWSIYDVGTLSGPTIRPLSVVDANPSDLVRQSCYMAEVEFVIGAEDPFLFKPWLPIATGWDCVAMPSNVPIGIDGIIVDFGNSATGALAVVLGSDCGAAQETLFTFSGMEVGSRLIYDSARHRAYIIDAEGRILDALSFGVLNTNGLPLEWLQLDSEFGILFCVCPSGDGAGATIYRQHKEYG